MKKSISIIIFFITTIFLTNVSAQEVKINWHTFEEAVQLSRENPKKLMIDIYTDWCGWCKRMDKETFTHPVIVEYVNEKFYPVKLNAEQKGEIEFQGQTFSYVASGARGYHELAAALLNGQMSYPSIAYMSENLELLGAVPGYRTPQGLEPLLNFIAEDKYLTESFEEFEKNYKSKIE